MEAEQGASDDGQHGTCAESSCTGATSGKRSRWADLVETDEAEREQKRLRKREEAQRRMEEVTASASPVEPHGSSRPTVASSSAVQTDTQDVFTRRLRRKRLLHPSIEGCRSVYTYEV